jgi:hypothetical protein
MLLVGIMMVIRGHADEGTPKPGAGDNPFRLLAKGVQIA